MSSRRWSLDTEIEDDGTSPERPVPSLVSLHFIRTALRRRLWVCVLAAVLGLLAAGTFLVALPLPHQAKASLVLAYDPEVDPSRAMATNVSLLQTRSVAVLATQRLGLTVAPEDFLKSFTVDATSSELMILTLTAPSDAEAVRQLEGLTATYLEFRAGQLTLQSETFVNGLQDRIKALQDDRQKLSKEIEELYATPTTNSTDKLNDAITQRTYINSRIETLQQSVEDATLRSSAVVASSRVLDPPAAEPGLAKRTIALTLASGLIGGAALGCGTVLFFAITSDKLRRRADIASALGVTVPVSVGRITALSKVWRWFPPLTAADHRRSSDRQRLAQAIEDELLSHPSAHLIVAGLDNTDELGFAVAELAGALAARDYPTTVIDLTERSSRGLNNAVWTPDLLIPPTVLRPRGLPALARGAGDLLTAGRWDDDDTAPPSLGDVTIVLADLDPAVGADHLTAWADRVIVVVTAGRSSVEKIRTVGELVRAAGLDLRFAALLHTERTDDSSGLGLLESPTPVPLRDSDDRAQPVPRSEAR